MAGRTLGRTAGGLLVCVAAAALAVGAGACDAAELLPLEPGWRRWVVTVRSESSNPATLAVAEDRDTMGDLVGRATPSIVPAMKTVDVTFDIPPRGGWAIFVNPGQRGGALITSVDIPPDVSGALPITITVTRGGSPSVAVPAALPGWFGS